MNTGLTKTKQSGDETQLRAMRMSAVKLTEFSTPEQVASVGLQCIREIFPLKAELESDLAVRLRIEMLTDIVVEVGPEKFLAAVKKAITLSYNRFDCTIKKIRECADLFEKPTKSPALRAWELTTEIVHKHVRKDGEGYYRLEPHVRIGTGGIAFTDPVPAIPDAIRNAVRALGGWQALANTVPEYWHQRMKDFIALYEE